MMMVGLVMLYRHRIIVKSPMLPMVLREQASIALGAFPGNSIILGIFLEGERVGACGGKPGVC